jgi:hypothetical protein
MKKKLYDILILVMIVLLLPLTTISQNINKSDSVLVSIEDLRTSIKIFSEYEKEVSKKLYYEKIIVNYDILVSTSKDIENEYKLVISSLENIGYNKELLHKIEIQSYKEKLRKSNIRFSISTGAAVLLLIILL